MDCDIENSLQDKEPEKDVEDVPHSHEAERNRIENLVEEGAAEEVKKGVGQDSVTVERPVIAELAVTVENSNDGERAGETSGGEVEGQGGDSMGKLRTTGRDGEYSRGNSLEEGDGNGGISQQTPLQKNGSRYASFCRRSSSESEGGSLNAMLRSKDEQVRTSEGKAVENSDTPDALRSGWICLWIHKQKTVSLALSSRTRGALRRRQKPNSILTVEDKAPMVRPGTSGAAIKKRGGGRRKAKK